MRRRARRRWPTTIGTILAVEFEQGTHTKYVHIPVRRALRYSFRVAERECKVREVVPEGYRVVSNGFLRRLGSLQQGEQVPVYYHPQDHGVATVAPTGTETGTFLLVLVTVLMLGFAAYAWLMR